MDEVNDSMGGVPIVRHSGSLKVTLRDTKAPQRADIGHQSAYSSQPEEHNAVSIEVGERVDAVLQTAGCGALAHAAVFVTSHDDHDGDSTELQPPGVEAFA